MQRNAIGVAVGGVVTVVAYLAFLGWNALKDPATCTGPYDNGQVIGLALALVVVVAVCGAWRGEWGAAAAASVAVTAMFIGDAVTVDDPCAEASIWPVGAGFLLVGSAVGLGLVAALTTLTRHLLRRRRTP